MKGFVKMNDTGINRINKDEKLTIYSLPHITCQGLL